MRHALLVTLILAAFAVLAQCVDGALGNAAPASFAPLTASDVDAVVTAANASIGGRASIAVVDRGRRVPARLHPSSRTPNQDELPGRPAPDAAVFRHSTAPPTVRTRR